MSAGEIVQIVTTVGVGHWLLQRGGGGRRALRVANARAAAATERVERAARQRTPSTAELRLRLAVARHRPRRIPHGRHY